MLPGYLRLSELSDLARQFPSGVLPNDTLLPPVVDTLIADCAVYAPDGRLRAAGSCEATLFSRQRADRTGHEDTLLTSWPDGKTTSHIVPSDAEKEYQQGDWRLISDFLDERVSYEPPDWKIEQVRREPPDSYDSPFGTCFRNERTEEIRCVSPIGITESNVSPFRR